MNKLATVVAIAFIVLLGAGGAEAVTETWNFNVPDGNQGSTHNYASSPSGLILGLAAFNTASLADPGFLWGKNDGPGETGVGVCPTADGAGCNDHEIDVPEYIRIDFDSLALSNVLFKIGSVQIGEAFEIFTSNSNDSFNTTAVCASATGVSNVAVEFTVSCSGLQRFAFVHASNTDVVLETVTANSAVAEPGTMLLAGLGLVALGYAARRRLFDR
jgi:hypothetical protein